MSQNGQSTGHCEPSGTSRQTLAVHARDTPSANGGSDERTAFEGVERIVNVDGGDEEQARPDALSGSPVESPEAVAPRRWIYRNLTPWRIEACFTRGDDARDGNPSPNPSSGRRVAPVLSIPALGEVTIPHEDVSQLDTLTMRRLGQIEVRPAPSELLSNLPRAIVIFGWLGVALFVGVWALFVRGAAAVPWAAAVAATIAVPVGALIVATAREIHVYRRFSAYRRARSDMLDGSTPSAAGADGDGRNSLEGVERASRIRSFVDGVPRHAAELSVLLAAMVVSVVGLGVAIHLSTQLNDLLPVDYGALFGLDDPFRSVSGVARSSPAFWQLLVGHVAQWILVSVAALTPAAMYFQFDRQRLASIQRRWVQEVFRLDPTVRTVRDIEAKYGSQIESSFGRLGADSGLRLRSGRRSPVIVATLLTAVGWFLVISATEVPSLIRAPARDLGPAAPGQGLTELVWPAANGGAGRGPFPVSTFFRPDLSLVGYAFMGAYVFTLLHVIRGYRRRDLHPKTYNTVVVRILTAYVLALVVSVVYDGPAAEVLLFFVGFMPQSALVWLREHLSAVTGPLRRIPLQEPAPLTDLEGIDLYDRTRLAEEGINNVEALAHADIVELMSSTRISAAQLVDWTDQAILYLRVGGDAEFRSRRRHRTRRVRNEAAWAEARSGPPEVFRNLDHLRAHGIRTATDLLQAYDQALRRGTERAVSDSRDEDDRTVRRRTAAYRAAEVGALREALDLPGAPHRGGVYTIQTIIDTLPDEEWFVQVRNWRDTEFGAIDAWYHHLDGSGWELAPTPELPPRVARAMQPFTSVPMSPVAAPAAAGSDPLELVIEDPDDVELTCAR